MNSLHSYLDSLETEYEIASRNMGEASWNNYSKEGVADLDGAKKKLSTVFKDAGRKKRMEELFRESGERCTREIERRVKLLQNCFTSSAVDGDRDIYSLCNELEVRLTGFRFEWEGERVPPTTLQNVLEKDPDPRRREQAYRTGWQLAEHMRDDLLRLMRLRNEKATLLGYRNYASLALSLEDIDPSWLERTLDKILEMTEDPYCEYLQRLSEELGQATLKPWDLSFGARRIVNLPDEYFPEAKAIDTLRHFTMSIGFPFDDLKVKILVREIPYGGLGLAVSIPDDFRILLNPDGGHRFYHSLFHEYGHAMQSINTRVKSPILKGYEWVAGAQNSAFAEGMAGMLARFTSRRDWLSIYTRLDSDTIEKYLEMKRYSDIMAMRFLASKTLFEIRAYRDLDADLDSLERDIFEKSFLMRFPEGGEGRWASNTLYVTYPIYHHNYILSDVISAQIHDELDREFGEDVIRNWGVAAWLIDGLYSDGETLGWQERLERATGRRLDLEPYLSRLCRS